MLAPHSVPLKITKNEKRKKEQSFALSSTTLSAARTASQPADRDPPDLSLPQQKQARES